MLICCRILFRSSGNYPRGSGGMFPLQQSRGAGHQVSNEDYYLRRSRSPGEPFGLLFEEQVTRWVDLWITRWGAGHQVAYGSERVVKIKGLVARCHSFCLFFVFYDIHTFIESHSHNTFIRRHSPRFLSISSWLISSVGKPPCGAEPWRLPGDLWITRWGAGHQVTYGSLGEEQLVKWPIDH